MNTSAQPVAKLSLPSPRVTSEQPDLRKFGAEYAEGTPVFTMALTVSRQHLSDLIEHVPNTLFLQWTEDVTFAHCRSLGLDGPFTPDHKHCFFVIRHELEYRAEVFARDQLLLASWVSRINKARLHRQHLVIRRQDQQPVFRAVSFWTFVELATRKPRRIPDDLARRFLGTSSDGAR